MYLSSTALFVESEMPEDPSFILGIVVHRLV